MNWQKMKFPLFWALIFLLSTGGIIRLLMTDSGSAYGIGDFNKKDDPFDYYFTLAFAFLFAIGSLLLFLSSLSKGKSEE